MRSREGLDSILVELVGEDHVYFQPPENSRIQCPCIIYALDHRHFVYADNSPYNTTKRYQVTYISKNPDDDIPDKLSKLPMTRFDRRYVVDKLYHDVFTIFY